MSESVKPPISPTSGGTTADAEPKGEDDRDEQKHRRLNWSFTRRDTGDHFLVEPRKITCAGTGGSSQKTLPQIVGRPGERESQL